MKIVALLIGFAGFLLQCESPDETFYVDVDHPQASDNNPGTESRPWRTIVHAAAAAGPGDTVLVKAGVYDHGEIEIESSGVTLAAHPDHARQAIIRGAGIRSAGNSDIVIAGFRIEHTPGHAIRVMGPGARDIVVVNNHTHDTWKSGISIRGVSGNADPGNYDGIRNVLVTGNLVELGTNGGGGEIISVGSGAIDVDIAYNEVRLGDPNMTGGDEGIAFKEGVRDSRIFGNVVHDLSDKAIHIDGGSSVHDPQITNIEIFDNILYDLPSHGMWVTTEGRGDVDGVYIHDNIVFDVDGDGILVYAHPDGVAAGGTVRNVLVSDNTVWDAGQRNSGFGGLRVNHPTATGVVFVNNIAWNNNGYDIRGEAATSITHNLCREASRCEINSDPQFVWPPFSFELGPGSPAIGVGVGGEDLGAG